MRPDLRAEVGKVVVVRVEDAGHGPAAQPDGVANVCRIHIAHSSHSAVESRVSTERDGECIRFMTTTSEVRSAAEMPGAAACVR